MDGNLMDVLGILIAFITVMLVFSIVITSLVQATQAVLRFRARTLRDSLAKILKDVQKDATKGASGAADNALKLLNESDSALLFSKFKATGFFSNLFGPQVSWIDQESLDKELRKNTLSMNLSQIHAVSEKFKHIQKPMQKIYLRKARMVTLFWAVIVAIYFQLSTPQLLHDFSASPEERAEAHKLSSQLLEENQDGNDLTLPAEFSGTALLKIEPWAKTDFYLGKDGNWKTLKDYHWNNIVGVLVTILLLSLGAPFWFNMLKSVVSLRDSLAPKQAEDGSETGSGTAPRASQMDERIALLKERAMATTSPVVKANLQKEINDLELARAETFST